MFPLSVSISYFPCILFTIQRAAGIVLNISLKVSAPCLDITLFVGVFSFRDLCDKDGEAHILKFSYSLLRSIPSPFIPVKGKRVICLLLRPLSASFWSVFICALPRAE